MNNETLDRCDCGVSGSLQYRPVEPPPKTTDTYALYVIAKNAGFLPKGTTFEVFKEDYYRGA